jgi:pyridoxamine 5'-phosphate oxidase
VSISTTSKMAMSLSTQRAPWRDILDSHLKQTSGYDFTIATVGLDSQGRFVPRVRTCGCRGFFPELELHPKGQEAMDEQVEGAGNPPVYESDMLSFTTDVRMEKLGQLEESGHAIEAIFWLEDVMTQWRVKGRAYAIGNPDPEETSELEMASQKEIMKGLRVKSNANEDTAKWTWEKAVTKYFANHSPIMRGMLLSNPVLYIICCLLPVFVAPFNASKPAYSSLHQACTNHYYRFFQSSISWTTTVQSAR